MKNTILKNKPKSISGQYGFTLIELMISLVLGLLISAAVMQVFLTSQRVDRIQTAGSEIQDKAVFGLQSIEPQIRLANLGNNGVAINDATAKGGVVLTATDDAGIPSNIKADIGSGYLTRGQDMASAGTTSKWNGTLTNTGVNSDQLTIQYINTTGRTLSDCEGQEIAPDAHVITRYFIVEDSNETGEDRKNLNLNCDAGRIEDDEFKDFAGNDNGQTIIQNIDQFNIRLGVQQADATSGISTYADMTVKEYMDIDVDSVKPNITNIRIAILARSTANSPEASPDSFMMFGDEQTLKSQVNAPKYLRRVYESNILLRNARVMHVIDSSSAP